MTLETAALMTGLSGVGCCILAVVVRREFWRRATAAASVGCIAGLTMVPMTTPAPSAATKPKQLETTPEAKMVKAVGELFAANYAEELRKRNANPE